MMPWDVDSQASVDDMTPRASSRVFWYARIKKLHVYPTHLFDHNLTSLLFETLVARYN